MKIRLGKKNNAAFTMVELLTVVVVISILTALSFPAFRNMRMTAQSALSVANLHQIAVSTVTWSTDHGGKLPSPIYSGTEETLPTYWDFQETGTGLWLDGTVFAAMYVEKDGGGDRQDHAEESYKYSGPTPGGHIKGTFFESVRSVSVSKVSPIEDYYLHSYAMNANLKYDRIHDSLQTPDPWYTEKSIAQLVPTKGLLYIDCAEKNVITAEDFGDIEATMEERWGDKYVIAAFIDGHVEKMHRANFPQGNPDSDPEASLFWRGVDFRD